MPPLEVDPVRLGAAVALALAAMGVVAYQLGWHERAVHEAERQRGLREER